MIFAREVNDGLTGLVKKLDKACSDNAKARMGSFVVFCNDDEKLEDKLKDVAKKEGLKKVILSIDTNKAGPYPEKSPFAAEADVTVMLYNKRKVVANHTFKKGHKLSDKDIEKILDDLPKIVGKK